MRHFLNNIPVSPRNVLEIGLVTDNTGNPEILQVDTDTIILPETLRLRCKLKSEKDTTILMRMRRAFLLN